MGVIRRFCVAVRSRLTTLLGTGLVFLCAAGTGGVGADDPKLAQTLMEAGKKALEEGDLDRAFASFEKASNEDHSLFEYQYWQGVVSEKRGDRRLAVASYETFLRNFDKVNQQGASVPPATVPLAKKARARLEVLAAGPIERRKLEDALVAKLMDAAEGAKASSPEAARRAARWVLRLRRGHKAASALLAELGDKPEVQPEGSDPPPDDEVPVVPQGDAPSPFVDVPTVISGKSLLLSQVFGTPVGWTWTKVDERWVATIDEPGQGRIVWPNGPIASGGRFACELEARILTEHRLDWAMGMTFGKRDDLVIVFFQRNQVVATRASPAKGFADICGKGLSTAADPSAWHRLTYVLDGTALKAWLDGQQVLDCQVPFARDVLGTLGLWYQYGKVEVRSLRFGALP